jgi:hypothetical protein
MPNEYRRLVFSNEELRQALDTHLGSAAMLPGGRLENLRFGKESDDELIATFEGSDHAMETVLSISLVTAALIKQCLINGIPLPRRARKWITLSGDSVALDFRKPSKLRQSHSRVLSSWSGAFRDSRPSGRMPRTPKI